MILKEKDKEDRFLVRKGKPEDSDQHSQSTAN